MRHPDDHPIRRTRRSRLYTGLAAIFLGSLAIAGVLLSTATRGPVFADDEGDHSHFRYATISATSDGNGNVVFRLIAAFRRSAYLPRPNVGSVITEGVGATRFAFGDGNITPVLRFTITASNPSEDWVIGEALDPQTHTPGIKKAYSSDHQVVLAGLSDAAGGAPCCRLLGLNNRAVGFYPVRAQVRPWIANQTPVASVVPVVVVPEGPAVTFPVPASDADGHPIRWRLSTSAEAGGGLHPPNLTIDPATGVMTWNNVGLNKTNFWTTQVIIEELDGAGNVKCTTPVDFLLKIVEQTSTPPNLVIAPPGPLTVVAGNPVSFNVHANDPDPGATVTLASGGLPVGATMTPPLPATGNPIDAQFNWTPTPEQAGSHVIVFSATDNTGLQTTKSITLTVLANRPPTVELPMAHVTARTKPNDPCAADDSIIQATATASDPDNDPLTFQWFLVGLGPNGTDLDVTAFGTTDGNTSTLQALHPHRPHLPYHVKVVVSDGQASAQADLMTNQTPNLPPAITELTNVQVVASTVEGDPCTAAPDRLKGHAEACDPDGDAVRFTWLINPENGTDPTVQKAQTDYANEYANDLDVTEQHRPHHLYHIRVVVDDGAYGGSDSEDATARTPNLPPVIFSIRWHRPGHPCDDVTDTPSPAAHTVRRSLVASPADGIEGAPGVFLNALAAGCDPDGDPLTFAFLLDGTERQVGGAHASPDGQQNRKLIREELADQPTHTLQIRVVDNFTFPDARPGETTDPITRFSNQVSIVDTREQLRQYARKALERIGRTVGESEDPLVVLQNTVGPILERANADLRIHGYGFAGEVGSYGTFPPVFYTPTTGQRPLLLVEEQFGLSPPVDASPYRIRLDGWVTRRGALTPAEEARGEYGALLLNLEAGFLRLDDLSQTEVVPTDSTGQPLPRVLKIEGLLGGCFPRQTIDQFELPSPLSAEDAASIMRTSVFFDPPWTPVTETAIPDIGYQDLADLGRLFNDKTQNILSTDPSTGGLIDRFARHRPHVPRVDVHAAVADGETVGVVCWDVLTDPHCDHATFAVTVKVNGNPVPVAPDANFAVLPPLAPGVHEVTVEVAETIGGRDYKAARTVRFRVAGSPPS